MGRWKRAALALAAGAGEALAKADCWHTSGCGTPLAHDRETEWKILAGLGALWLGCVVAGMLSGWGRMARAALNCAIAAPLFALIWIGISWLMVLATAVIAGRQFADAAEAGSFASMVAAGPLLSSAPAMAKRCRKILAAAMGGARPNRAARALDCGFGRCGVSVLYGFGRSVATARSACRAFPSHGNRRVAGLGCGEIRAIAEGRACRSMQDCGLSLRPARRPC